MVHAASRRRYRSVFLSDLHLGAPACRAEALLAFLDGLDCERLYLLGDVVDGLRLRRRWFWPPSHALVLERLLDFARRGTTVTYVPGNHDAFARDWCGLSAAGVRIERETAHETVDGRRYLLAHGDAYDPCADSSLLKRLAGDLLYRGLLRLDGVWRLGRRSIGLSDCGVATQLKARSTLARRVVRAFEARLSAEAKARGFDGIICGHIHSASARTLDGVGYLNCGDWVESCSAVVEEADGALNVLRWGAAPARSPSRTRRAPRLAPA